MALVATYRTSRNVEQTCSRHSRPDRRGVIHHGHPQGQAAEQPHSGHGGNRRKEGIANLSIDGGRLGTVYPLRGVQARVTYVLQRQNKASFKTRLDSQRGWLVSI